MLTISLNLRIGIMSGLTLAQALNSLYGQVFGPVYSGLVKTGEDAGELEATLQRMLVMLRKQDAIKGKIVNASIYPGVLLTMMTGLNLYSRDLQALWLLTAQICLFWHSQLWDFSILLIISGGLF